MESSMDRRDHLSEDDLLPALERDRLASPPLLQGPATARWWRYPFSTKKRAFFTGVMLLIVVILGVRFLAPYVGPHPKWSFQAGGYVHIPPLVANGMVYVISGLSIYDNTLSALDARSGSKQWSYQLEGFISDENPPIVADGAIYVVAEDSGSEQQSTVYVLDAKSGHEQWSFQTGLMLSPPAVANGIVYLASSNGTLYALDAHSGHTLWAERSGEKALSSPLVADGLVYAEGFSADNMVVYALDASTGHQRWAYQMGAILTAWTPLVVVNGLVYVTGVTSSLGGVMYALDAQSGGMQWSFQTGSPIYSPPTVSNGIVYLSDDGGDLNALDARSGAPKWSFQVMLSAHAIEAFPTVVKDIVYLAAKDGTMYALDASTGHKRWSEQVNYFVGSFDLSPIVLADGFVYGDTQAGEVFALDGASGSERWSYHTAGDLAFAPVVADGLTYVMSYDTLYAFQPFS